MREDEWLSIRSPYLRPPPYLPLAGSVCLVMVVDVDDRDLGASPGYRWWVGGCVSKPYEIVIYIYIWMLMYV